jgi:arsenite methyltransferase
MSVGPSNRRRGSYGIDAPYVPALFGALGLFFVALAVLNATEGATGGVITTGLVAVFFLGCMTSYLYTTRVGKFVVWSQILDGLSLGGAEQVLDMGCGRGAVLLLAAKRLDTGGAHGEIEGLADRVTLHTADMTALPFEDATFDVVVSSLAIHNIKKKSGRQQAVVEGLRVLRPGGRLTIADFRHVDEYAKALGAPEVADVRTRGLGWRFWYGGPWAGTKLVTATKPSAGSVGS